MPKLSELDPSEFEVVGETKPKKSNKPLLLSDLQAGDFEVVEPITSAEALLRGAAQGITLGFADELAGLAGAVSETLLGDRSFSEFGQAFKEQTDESRAAFDRARESKPGEFASGQIGGGLASLLIPGGIAAKGAGALAKAGAAGKVVGAIGRAPAIAKAGALGAISEVGASNVDFTDPSAERLAGVGKAALKGFAVGSAGQAVFSSVLKVAGPKIKETVAKLGEPSFRRRAEERAVKAAFGQNKKAIMELQRSGRLHKMGRDLLDADPGTGRPIVRAFKNVEDIAQQAAESAEIQGKKIGDIVDSFDDSFNKAVTSFKKSPEFDDLTTLQQTKVIKEIKDNFLVSPNRIAERIKEKAVKLRDNPGEFQLMNKLNKLADEFEGVEPYSLRRAQEVKNSFNWSPLDPTKNQFGQEATNDVRRIVNEEMERVVDQASSSGFKRFLIDAVGGEKAEVSSKILEDYKKAKDLYRSYKTAADAAKERSLSDLANRFISPSDTGAGLAMLGGTIASGGATTAAIAQGAAVSAANKFLRTRGSSAAAVGLDKIADLLGRDPGALGKFGDSLLNSLQKQGGAGLAVEHLRLMKADPDYKLTVEQLTKPSGR